MAHSDSQYERPDQLSDQAPRGVIYLIGIQLFSRVVTFSANQILILHVCPQALGMSMQLELFANTVLYFARESIRAAAQAAPPSADGRNQSKPFDEQGVKEGVPNGRVRTPSAQAVVNMSYFASLLGLTLLLVFRFLYVRFFLRELLHAPYFSASFAVATVATGLEILAEPCFAAVQHDMLYRSRAIVETFSALSRGIFSCGIALWMSRQAIDPGPLPFAVGQIVSSLVVFWGYLVVARRAARENGYSLLPVPLLEQEDSCDAMCLISRPLFFRSINMFFQSIVKHILTQGDSMILAICSTLEDQGLYALASNYGGLVARIVLQPIEESSRLFFGRTLPVANGQVKRKEETGNAQAYLVNILRLYSVLTVLVWAAGPLLLPVAFNIVLSSRWASLNVQETLLSYCYYIPFLAFNGITEAFVSSAASNSELRTQASWMWACSVAFAFFAYFALKVAHLGVRGLVWVNIVNMTLRTAWSLRFIRIYFRRLHQELKLRDILPKQETCVVGFCAWGSLFILHTAAVNTIDLVKLLCTGTTVVFTILYLEKDLLKEQIVKYRAKDKYANLSS